MMFAVVVIFIFLCRNCRSMPHGSSEFSGRKISAVETAMTVSTALKELDGAGITEIADHTGLAKSMVYNYLMTLHDQNLVERDENEFRLSLRFLELGQHTKRNLTIYDYSKSEIEDLAEETGAAVHVIVEQNGMGYVINQALGEEAVATSTRVGHTVELAQTAAGKAILAHFPEEHTQEIMATYEFPQQTEKTITSEEDLLAELGEIRESGVAFADEELLHSFRAVGAPVINTDNSVLGAISVSGPTAQMEEDYFRNELPKKVNQKSDYIESKISAFEQNSENKKTNI